MSLSRRWQSGLKRILDVSAAFFGLLVLSPLLLAVALAVRVTLGAPVLFRQQRPGWKGRPFTLFKFRTMAPPQPDQVWFRSDEERLTRLGRFLRKSSLDELPELWNVLKGEMSLVGPRPLLMEYLEKYTEEENRRHEVRPGITGWAQVNGRQAIPFSERLRLDVWYVEHWSLWLDIKILIKTMGEVFRGGGVVPGQELDAVDDIGLSPDRRRTPADESKGKQ